MNFQNYEFKDLLLEPTRNGIYKKKEFHGSGARIINMGELFGNPRLYDIDMKRVELNNNELSKCLVKEGDLLFARRSLTAEGAGKCIIIKEVNENTTFESSIIRARPDKEIASSDYLYYFFSSPRGRHLIRSIMRQVAVAGITGSDLNKLNIPIPSIDAQKRIAGILNTLDDKIELNRRMNETLEAMAQALFQSWFVDFDPVLDKALEAGKAIPEELQEKAERRRALGEKRRALPADVEKLFPDEFERTDEMGWVPKGWKIQPIGELVKRYSVGKKYSQKTASAIGNVPVLDQGKSGVIGYHNEEPGVVASPEDPIIVFANHTCYMKIVMHDFSAIQNVLPFKGKDHGIYWTYYATQGRQAFIEYKGHWPDFILHKVAIPDTSIDSTFDSIVSDLEKERFENQEENSVLEQLRDTLLPKLISGELRIPDAEKLVANTL